MLAKLFSVAITGIDADLVEVELDLSHGMPGLVMVGMADKSVQESRDRVKSAILNSGYQYPNRKMVINLAPADLYKEGTHYDLPIALSMLAASEQLDGERLKGYLAVGELSLDGRLRQVRGVLPAAITAKQKGMKGIICPLENVREATVLGDGLAVVAVANLADVMAFLSTGQLPPHPPQPEEVEAERLLDYADIRGHEHLKRALVVSAAGGHNCWMGGPPGSGKTMAAKRLPSILPGLSHEESLETTKIFSIAGHLQAGQGLLSLRPFRSPHHSISGPGLVGGGSYPRPGEISLSHNGVLFLDEAPEFARNILETLRQPLEDGVVTISRAAAAVTYPARFMLVLSQNLCPCGRRGDSRKRCACTPKQVQAYLDKLSGPLLDRIDIQVEVPALAYDDLRARPGQGSAQMREQVVAARQVQAERFPEKSSPVNALMSEKEIGAFCQLDANCENLLRTAMDELGLSARGHARILKVARTIADLDGSGCIGLEHLSEAIQYRILDRKAAY